MAMDVVRKLLLNEPEGIENTAEIDFSDGSKLILIVRPAPKETTH